MPGPFLRLSSKQKQRPRWSYDVFCRRFSPATKIELETNLKIFEASSGLVYLCAYLARSKRYWPGGVIGAGASRGGFGGFGGGGASGSW